MTKKYHSLTYHVEDKIKIILNIPFYFLKGSNYYRKLILKNSLLSFFLGFNPTI